jgi:PIN domain nuclease of toxin-antitoxin system
MSFVQLETHVVVWLHEPLLERLAPALPHLENRQIVISPMVLLELQYLYEIGRIGFGAVAMLSSLAHAAGLSVARTPWEDVTRTALSLTWTRDPFDRLIAAQAITDAVPLVSADEHLRAHCPNTVWG